MSTTPHPTAKLIALVIAVALAGSACSSDRPGSSEATSGPPATTAGPTTAAPTTAAPPTAEPPTAPPTTTEASATTQPPTLEEQIAADFQGVQLDVIGGDPAPGDTTG